MKRKPRHHLENTRYLREIIERLRDFDLEEIRRLCERHRHISPLSPRPRAPRRKRCCPATSSPKRAGRRPKPKQV